MAAENALQSSCPVALSFQADRVVRESLEQIARIDGLLGTEWEEFAAQFLRPVLRAHQLAYEGVGQAAAAVLAWTERGHEAAPSLRRALATLERNERHCSVVRDVYAGELRAHRAGLNALLAYVENPEIPDIRFEDARVVYIYPFTVPDLDGEKVCRLIRELPPGALGEKRLFRSSETMLTCVWSGHGRRRSEYGGVNLSLPHIIVKTTGGEALEHRAEVRLSKLGNHYVRIHRTIIDAKLHHLNQVLRRVSSEMGAESINEHDSDQVTWEKLPDYAACIVDCIVGALRGTLARSANSVAPTRESPPEGDRQFRAAIDVYLHVLLEVRAASIVGGVDSGRAASTSEICRAADALFRTPVQSLPTALEEWARLDVKCPDTLTQKELRSNLLGKSRFPNDFIGIMYNSTVVVMPDTPNWTLLQYEEQAEFTASLPPLIKHWRKLLNDAVTGDSRDLIQLSSTDLAKRRFELQALVGDIRNQVAMLNSIDLCGTLADRRFIDELYEAAGLSELHAELDATITRVESTYERMRSLIAHRDERRTRRYQVIIEIILTILAVSSLADVLGLGNDLLNLSGRTTAWWEIGGLVTVAILTAALIFVLSKLRDD
jgi:hypothetical protein